VAGQSHVLRAGALMLLLAGSFLVASDVADAADFRSDDAASNNQSGVIRRTILDGITKSDPAVCTGLFTDRGIVDDVNALYVKGFNGPLVQDPAEARSKCEQVHATDATPSRSLVKVKKLTVAKKTAKASVEVGVGGTYRLGLVRDAGTWKIDSVA
jgi:hypothetical protein